MDSRLAMGHGSQRIDLMQSKNKENVQRAHGPDCTKLKLNADPKAIKNTPVQWQFRPNS